MRKFTTIRSVAAALPESDIDTDIIFPARFLLLLDRAGLGQQLFHERRRSRPGQPPFILNQPPFDKSEILVAGPNFGSGSSREQAVWALADFGIRCVIAPSFGEIFHANCFRNGVLPLVLNGTDYDQLLVAAQAGEEITVDLEDQKIVMPGAPPVDFAVDPYRRRSLLLGLDEIGAILTDDAGEISAFEARQREAMPWLYLATDQLAGLAGHDREPEHER